MYNNDALERQWYEQRQDWNAMAYPPAWAARYDISQSYDKNGNRTGYDKNVRAGDEQLCCEPVTWNDGGPVQDRPLQYSGRCH